jgi:hypothetical protein
MGLGPLVRAMLPGMSHGRPDQGPGGGAVSRSFPTMTAVIVADHGASQTTDQSTADGFGTEYLSGGGSHCSERQKSRGQEGKDRFHDEGDWRYSTGRSEASFNNLLGAMSRRPGNFATLWQLIALHSGTGEPTSP